MVSVHLSTATSRIQGDDKLLVRRSQSLVGPTAQNLGIQVFNRGAEKKITVPRPL